jgi:hypothetical protein
VHTETEEGSDRMVSKALDLSLILIAAPVTISVHVFHVAFKIADAIEQHLPIKEF